MALADFLKVWGVTKTRTATKAEGRAKYGVIESGKGYIKVRAPSGADALDIAGVSGRTQAGRKFTVANHQGNGVYYVETEDW